MPVVEAVAQDYADEVEFVAVAWKSDLDSTAARAAELLPSGVVRWGLDEPEAVFAAYGIGYQPWTVLVVDGVEVARWAGALSEADLRSNVEALIELAA